jgi:hypothetical protein
MEKVVRGLTDFLITFHIGKGVCGRHPALVGLLLTLSIPVGVLLLLIGEAYPGGFTTFAWRAVRVLWEGFH